MESIFLHYITGYKILGYAILFFGMVLEGEAVLFAFLFLTRQNIFNIYLILPLALIGVLLGDLGWYFFGKKVDRKYFFGRALNKVSKQFDPLLINREFRTIFISKFVYGIHHAILMRAGDLRLDIKRFFKYDFISTIIWIAVVGGIGYIYGASYQALRHYFKFAEIGLLLGLLLFFLGSRLVSRYLK